MLPFWAAMRRYRSDGSQHERGVYLAFTALFALFAMFILADEFFHEYRVEGDHRGIAIKPNEAAGVEHCLVETPKVAVYASRRAVNCLNSSQLLTQSAVFATMWDRRSSRWKGGGMRNTGEKMRARIVDAIGDLTETNSRPPTNRELGEYLGGKSTGHIDYHLRILKEQGKISHDPKKSRGIGLATGLDREPLPMRGRQVPIIGMIAAGQPIEAVDTRDDYVTVTGIQGDDLFALRVRGKSMIEDLIDDGDIVVCRQQSSASNGDTVVALITSGPSEAGEATLKRFYQEPDQIRLEPRNPTMQPIFVHPNDLMIQGRVVTVIRELQ